MSQPTCQVCKSGTMRKATSGHRHGGCGGSCGTGLAALSLLALFVVVVNRYLVPLRGQGAQVAGEFPYVAAGVLGFFVLAGMALAAPRKVLKCDSCGAVVARE